MSIKPKVDGYNESKSDHGSQPSPKGLWLGSTLMRWSSWMLLSQPTFTTSGNVDGLFKFGV